MFPQPSLRSLLVVGAVAAVTGLPRSTTRVRLRGLVFIGLRVHPETLNLRPYRPEFRVESAQGCTSELAMAAVSEQRPELGTAHCHMDLQAVMNAGAEPRNQSVPDTACGWALSGLGPGPLRLSCLRVWLVVFVRWFASLLACLFVKVLCSRRPAWSGLYMVFSRFRLAPVMLHTAR